MSDLKEKHPAHLEADTLKWWSSVLEEFDLEEHHIKLLTLACEAWDRCQLARKALKEHGMTFIDRLGTPRARPEIAIERDGAISFARLIRELDLDFDKTEDRSRPPALLSNRS